MADVVTKVIVDGAASEIKRFKESCIVFNRDGTFLKFHRIAPIPKGLQHRSSLLEVT